MKDKLKKLSRSEIRAYLHLVNQAPLIVSSEKIALAAMATTISINRIGETKQGRVIISKIRKKLGDQHFIKTRFGFGYVYTGEDYEDL